MFEPKFGSYAVRAQCAPVVSPDQVPDFHIFKFNRKAEMSLWVVLVYAQGFAKFRSRPSFRTHKVYKHRNIGIFSPKRFLPLIKRQISTRKSKVFAAQT